MPLLPFYFYPYSFFFSPHEIIFPKPTIGCGKKDGSPKKRSANHPNINGIITIISASVSILLLFLQVCHSLDVIVLLF